MPSKESIICRNCNQLTLGKSDFCNCCGAPLIGSSDPASSQQQWIVGSDPTECQILVAGPSVSKRHCVLRFRDGKYLLQDLNSSSKTYVNGEPIYGEIEVSRLDKITLGKSIDFKPYWPQEGSRARARATTTIATRQVLAIGRGPHNDIVINRPRVSWTHAELVCTRGKWTLTDMGSVHGTAVGSPENRIADSPVTLDDSVFFGEFSPEHASSPKKTPEWTGGQTKLRN